MDMLIPFLLNFVSQDTLNYLAVGTAFLLISSEAIGMVPSLKANGNLQLVRDILKGFLAIVTKKGGMVETLKAPAEAAATGEVRPTPLLRDSLTPRLTLTLKVSFDTLRRWFKCKR